MLNLSCAEAGVCVRCACVCRGGGGGGVVAPALVKVYDVFPWLMYGQCPFVKLE